MGTERGIPLSAAALAICQENNLLDEIVTEANVKVLDWVSFPLDPQFESTALRNSDGVYYNVMAGLSRGEYSAAEAASKLIEGINAELGE